MTAGDRPYYYVELSVRGVPDTCVLTVNGVKVGRWHNETVTLGKPVNHMLVGSDNTVTLTITSTEHSSSAVTERSEQTSSFEDVAGSLVVERVTEDTVVVTAGEEKRDAVRSVDVGEAVRQRLERSAEPTSSVELELAFDSEDVPSFRERLREAPVVDDEEELRDYAMELRDALEERRTDDLYEEFEVKFEEYDRAFPSRAPDDSRAWFRQHATESLFEESARQRFDFTRDDLLLEPWAGGRVWELGVERDDTSREFVLVEDDEGTFVMDVYVGDVAGDLRIVR